MSAFDIRDTFQRFMPETWIDGGVVRRSELPRGKQPLLASVKLAVVLAAGIAGASNISTAQARETAAWESTADHHVGGGVEVPPDWGAVIDFISRRPVLPENDEPEMLF